ncbi:MAG: methyltransferase domain-containing protein [Patescibacteria group bacterium]
MSKSTSWGKVANWYDNLLEKDAGTYQKTLIIPNLLRLLQIKRGEIILDLACGQGFFSREFARLQLPSQSDGGQAKAGAKVIGVDISQELIDLAKQHPNNGAMKQFNNRISQEIEYHVSQADNLSFLKNNSIDKIAIILSLQNIGNVDGVIKECSRVLKPNGKLFIVLNHPAFRIPKQSSWGWDETHKIQYRRIDGYLRESKETIQMHPGNNPKEKTISFHRPLQFYFKKFNKYNFCVSRLEEWNANKVSESGPRSNAEDTARREIPLFLFLEALKK